LLSWAAGTDFDKQAVFGVDAALRQIDAILFNEECSVVCRRSWVGFPSGSRGMMMEQHASCCRNTFKIHTLSELEELAVL